MRARIIGNWSFIRILRLVVGTVGTIQGFILQEFELSLIAFLLVYMAIADTGDNQYEVELKELNQNIENTENEKVDRIL